MTPHWRYRTRWGTFAIAQSTDGRWHPLFEGEDLGSYPAPEGALDDLVGGHTFTPSNGLDTSEAGLPDALLEWEPVRRA